MIRSWIVTGVLLTISGFGGLLNAQSAGDLVNFLQTGEEDASKLTSAYINPLVEGLSYGMNGGWYTTAKAHKTLGFDLSVSLNGVFIPSSQRYFEPGKLGLNNTQLSPNDPDGKVPTVIGPEESTTYETVIQTPDGPQRFTFDGPEGLDMKKRFKVQGVVTPMIQIGVGIYKSTDLKIRFAPETKVGDDGRVKMIGFGLMHDIKQHIPGLKIMPFDLSVLIGYTKVSGDVNMESAAFPPPAGNTDAQRMPFELNGWLVQALISKKLSMFTFYGGVGYNAIKSNAHVKGSYVIYSGPNGSDVTLTDPVNLDFKNKSFRLNGGFRFNLAAFFINAEYIWQEYSTATLGLGLTFR
ncbi:MAG TPA: DUF6588 family protein [Cyclobacteriaceae bacterium]|nr:DUF6588 family protein [Cyclobacteriaceae bacterium]